MRGPGGSYTTDSREGGPTLPLDWPHVCGIVGGVAEPGRRWSVPVAAYPALTCRLRRASRVGGLGSRTQAPNGSVRPRAAGTLCGFDRHCQSHQPLTKF